MTKTKNNTKEQKNTRKCNIEEKLSKKKLEKAISIQPGEINEINNLLVPPYFSEPIDITTGRFYFVSPLAKVFFREHSNINEILDIYVEKNDKDGMFNKDNYLASIIRKVASHRKNSFGYPFTLFKFNTEEDEVNGKMLLTYPKIRTIEDLNDIKSYLSTKSIKTCGISMEIDNPLLADAREYLTKKEAKHGKDTSRFGMNATYHGARNYYEKHNLVENYYLDDVTVEDMLVISTYRKLVRSIMAEQNVPDSEYENIQNVVLKAMKTKRELLLDYHELFVYPKYNFISNNLTKQQEDAVTINRYTFFSHTNAYKLIPRHKELIPVDKDLPPLERAAQRQILFHKLYIRRANKKLPPFNHLHWIQPKSDKNQRDTSLKKSTIKDDQQPGPSNIWKRKNVSERNQSTDRSENIAEVAQVVQRSETMAQYSSKIDLKNEEEKILKQLVKYKPLIATIKRKFMALPDFDEVLWKSNKFVCILSYISSHLLDRDDEFIGILLNCPELTEQDYKDISDVYKINFSVHRASNEEIGEPLASSTQFINSQDIQERPFQNINDSVEDIVMNEKSKDVPTEVTIVPNVNIIKVEKLSESEKLDQRSRDSSCEIVEMDVASYIEISEDIENVDQNRILSLNNDKMDKYRQALNVETQDATDVELQEYNLIGRDDLLENVKKRTVRVKKTTKKLVYNNDDSRE